LEAYRFLGEGKNAASLKQIRAALSFAYKHWDLKNPFARIEPPLHKEPRIRYLLLADIRRFLAYLRAQTISSLDSKRRSHVKGASSIELLLRGASESMVARSSRSASRSTV
jgi:hypothetical protein